MKASPEISRLADFAMLCSHGDLDAVRKWLESIGARDFITTEHDFSCTAPSGMRVGFAASDPTTCAVQIGFAIAGAFWPQAFPGLLREVNRRWKEEKDASKRKEA